MSAFVGKCVILAIIFTQASCYTFVGPKVFGHSLSPGIWSDIFQYQPSIPLHVLRYYGDAYYPPRNLQNRNYYLPHDSYDDSDYYSNVLYYLPTGRSSSYFERAPPVNQIEELPELPDYEDESAEDDSGVSKSQRDWWLEKNVAASEDTDLSQLNRVDDLYSRKSTVSKTAPKQNSKNSRLPISKSRHDGIDGFGRKKGPEDRTYRPNTRKEEHASVYGKPVHHERHEDTNVRDLKSLLRGTPNTDDNSNADSALRRWEAGNDKRSGIKAYSTSETKENSAKVNPWTVVKPINTLTIYDEGGREIVPENMFDELKWKDYAPEQTSVFDTIKTLLALEDEVNESNLDGKPHKLLKRKPPAYKPPVKNKSSNKDRSRNQGSTTEVIPKSKSSGDESPSLSSTNPVKRSVGAAACRSDEDTLLVRELSAAKRQNS